MIFEHEIPGGSRLYFGKSASIKREIENICAQLLMEDGYEEMVTPLFSYHQTEAFDDTKELIRVNDSSNHIVTLRADSTVDVVRIATKRLGRSMESKKWFYIQPVYRFPTKEQYQVGAEFIGGSFDEILATASKLLDRLGIDADIQLANISIPNILSDKYGIDLNLIRKMGVEELYQSKYSWVKNLLHIHSVDDLNDLDIYPEDISTELNRLKNTANSLKDKKIVISPLYYASLGYYDSMIFRVFRDNTLYMMGGVYEVEKSQASGFALYTDACVSKIMQKGKYVK